MYLEIPSGSMHSVSIEAKSVVRPRFCTVRPRFCREDAHRLDDPVKYGLAVSLDVAEDVPVGVYEQTRQGLRSVAPIWA